MARDLYACPDCLKCGQETTEPRQMGVWICRCCEAIYVHESVKLNPRHWITYPDQRKHVYFDRIFRQKDFSIVVTCRGK